MALTFRPEFNNTGLLFKTAVIFYRVAIQCDQNGKTKTVILSFSP
jgi:hypothetical protein